MSSKLRNVSLRHLRCFLAVAESSSFTIAASRLFLTQSALTATIQQFEEAVGLKLFDRSTRRVTMTHEARRFKDEAEKILNHFDSAISDLQAFANGQKGQVRIAAVVSVIYHFLVDTIRELQQAYPNITVSLHDAGAELVEKMVVNGEIDFAISTPHKGFEDLVYTPLFEDRYGVICGPEYGLAKKTGAVCWSELNPNDYIGYTANTGIGTYLRTHGGSQAFFDTPHNEISSITLLQALLKIGDKFSIVPALSAHTGELSAFTFKELEGPALSREIFVITRKLRSLSPSSERFLNIMKETIARAHLPPGITVSLKQSDHADVKGESKTSGAPNKHE
ncbi:MAG TPA: LysR family transcriptional regulator [Eoetvoesiella sp.]